MNEKLHLFQFQTGTIESIKTSSIHATFEQFQFQTGTIESEDAINHLFVAEKFQFQTGTIERTKSHALTSQQL